MNRVDTKDLVGGVLVIAVGAVFAYAASFFPLGTGRTLGPGYFPIATGIITVLIGIGILISAFTRAGTIPRVSLRPFLAVLAAIAAFIVGIQSVGLVVTICLVVTISALASPKSSPLSVVGQCAFMALACWLVFTVGLGLPLPAFRSPF